MNFFKPSPSQFGKKPIKGAKEGIESGRKGDFGRNRDGNARYSIFDILFRNESKKPSGTHRIRNSGPENDSHRIYKDIIETSRAAINEDPSLVPKVRAGTEVGDGVHYPKDMRLKGVDRRQFRGVYKDPAEVQGSHNSNLIDWLRDNVKTHRLGYNQPRTYFDPKTQDYV
jgi:hypothetical protein